MITVNDIEYKIFNTYFLFKSFIIQFQSYYSFNFPNELLIFILNIYKKLLDNDINEFRNLFNDEYNFYRNLEERLLSQKKLNDYNYNDNFNIRNFNIRNFYNLNNYRNVAEEATITNAFNSEWIDSMIDESRKYKLNQDIPYVFITIDPSAGISRSLYILVSMFYLNNMCVVCLNINIYFKNNKDQFYSILEYYNNQYQIKINDYF